MRIVLPIHLIVSPFGGLNGGYALANAYTYWLTWSVSLLILEPVGIARARPPRSLTLTQRWAGPQTGDREGQT